ncbi:MAG: ABC transporter permease [Alphaproteobacteria bacterium]|nr:ABC transporter permease [Alphaproteobacteria bacterium]
MKIVLAFIKKEFLQIAKDPSSLIIAFILPLVLLYIYTFGINLDDVNIRLGIKNDDAAPETALLVESFGQNKYISSVVYDDKDAMYQDIVRSRIKGALIIPNDFSQKLASGQTAAVLLITDGAEINQVSYTQNYVTAIVSKWLANSRYKESVVPAGVAVQQQYRYNQEVNGVWTLVPSSLAVTMTLIGILLTALVVAREWERGTMEALLSTHIKPIHIVIGKYVPYFALGMASLAFNVLIMIFVLDIPFRGSYTALFGVSALFLFSCLGIGLIISSALKNQLLASMASLVAGFLPALMLSGLIFPIKSMPLFFQYLTLLLPPRYYVSFIKSEFLSGTPAAVLLSDALYLLVLGMLFATLVYRKTSRRLNA